MLSYCCLESLNNRGTRALWFHFALGPVDHKGNSASLLLLVVDKFDTWFTFLDTRILQPIMLCSPLNMPELSVNSPIE